ncbi:18938_t:CDS:1, partial [Racocetra persica]
SIEVIDTIERQEYYNQTQKMKFRSDSINKKLNLAQIVDKQLKKLKQLINNT